MKLKLDNGRIYFSTFIKASIIILFLIVTNTEAKIFYRIDLLSHYYEGISGVLAFLFIWCITIISMLETAFLKSMLARFIFSSLIIISAIFGFVYELIAETQIDYDSLSIMWEARHHTSDAILFYKNKLLTILFVTALTYFAFLARPKYHLDLTNIFGEKIESFHSKMKYLVILSPFFIVFLIAVMRGGYGTEGLPNQSKVLSLWTMIVISEIVADDDEIQRDTVSIIHKDRNNLSKPNIVLIVDESVSGDFIDVNSSDILPDLYKNRNLIVDFGNAVSASNCSSGSNFILRTSGNPNDINTSTLYNPYIWNYAKKAGYETVYIEAQAESGRFNNRMTLNEKKYIDEFTYAIADTRDRRDIKSSEILKDKLSNSKPSFIYIVKSGIHFPYESSYPQDQARFNPHMSAGHYINSRELVINSYKNAISWTINNYFKDLFENIDLSNTVIIYTSDHGQNLLDNGNQLTHCSKNNTSSYEGLVPLFILTSNEFYKSKFNQASIFNKNKLSHFNIAPTILLLLGFDENDIVKKHGKTFTSHDHANYQFISGIVSSYRIAISNRNDMKWNSIEKAILAGTKTRNTK